MCLSGYSSAVYQPMGTKLGMEVGDGHGKCTGDMETILSYYKLSTVCAGESQGGNPLARP